MDLVPWVVSALLGIAVLVLVGLLLRRGRDVASVRAPVHQTHRLPEPSLPAVVVGGLSSAPPQAATAPRVTSIRAPATAMASAVSARQAAKNAIARRDIRAAVVHYRDAGLIDEAVSLLVGVLGAPAEAASMLSARGDHERAADLYELAGRRAKAAREWAKVAEVSPDPGPYLRRVRRLDPGLADALEAAELESFDVHAAPTRMIRVSIEDLPPATDEEETDDGEDGEPPSSRSEMGDDDADRLAADAAEAVTRAFDSAAPPATEEDDEIPLVLSVRRASREPALSIPTGGTWNGGIEEDGLDASDSIFDADVLRAGVAIPLWELEAMTRDQPCGLANIEVFYRIGMARLAIGHWVGALEAFDAVEESSPGYRDADRRAEQVRAWQLCLGNRRTLDDAFDILGRFEERDDAILYRARERARQRDVLLHVPRGAPDLDYAARAEELALLDHPNLTRVLAGVPLDGGGVLCTETADGPTLSNRIALGPRPTVVDALRLTAQLCEAIEAGGSQRQRFIDPGDLRIAPGGLLKVMRWGWPRAAASADAAPFTAPTATEPESDERALVFAIGAVLVHALTGDAALAHAAHEEATWAEVEAKAPYLPAAVRAVAKRATSRDPAQRFPSVKGLRLAIRNLLKQVQRRASSMTIPAVS